MNYPRFNTGVFLMLIAVIMLCYLSIDTYKRYRADYYFHEIQKTHSQDWTRIHELIILGLHYAPAGDFYYKREAGYWYKKRLYLNKDTEAFIEGRKALMEAQHLNPFDSDTLIWILQLHIMAKDSGIIKDMPTLVDETARYLLYLDKHSPKAHYTLKVLREMEEE